MLSHCRFPVLLFAACSPFVSRCGAQCPEESRLQNFTGNTRLICPCFASGEEAGVVLEAPADHYPIEVLGVAIAWGSAAGGSVPSLEGAIHVYGKGLPDPGKPIFRLPGPVLEDGFINQFTLNPPPVIPSGPFTVSLQFANANAGKLSAPSVLDDGNGCRPGKNAVLVDTLGWKDACSLGVTGDWVIDVVYRRVECNPPPPEKQFVRGDDNQDGSVDISDPLHNLNYLFLGGPGPCLDAMDTNDDGQIDLSDPVYDLAFLFLGGSPPPEPHPGCGPDPGPMVLGCEDPPLCR